MRPSNSRPGATWLLAGMCGLLAWNAPATGQPTASEPMPVKPTGCTEQQRADTLREKQATVLQFAPRTLPSLDAATAEGGPLAGWRLSHGYVVLAGAGGVALDNVETQSPLPQLLLYAPAPSSAPGAWLDFDGSDGPYQLVGWAYIAPYEEPAEAPKRPCIAEHEWMVHEAGWHTRDGGMVLTPGAAREPADKPAHVSSYFWHPRAWDLHVWLGEAGTPVIADDNPLARPGGLELPPGAFFHLVDGKRYPAPAGGGS